MARNAISRELYNDLVAKGMIKPERARAGSTVANELRTRKCKNKRFATALAQAADTQSRTLALPLTFTLDWPPSLNAMWASTEHRDTGASIRVLTTKAKAWRAKAALELKLLYGGHSLAHTGPLTLELVFHGRFFHANGEMRKVDLSNRIKLLEDTVAAALHYDDTRHWRLVLSKAQSDHEHVQVTLLPGEPGPA